MRSYNLNEIESEIMFTVHFKNVIRVDSDGNKWNVDANEPGGSTCCMCSIACVLIKIG